MERFVYSYVDDVYEFFSGWLQSVLLIRSSSLILFEVSLEVILCEKESNM